MRAGVCLAVRHRQNCFWRLGARSAAAGACRGCRLSDLLGPLPTGMAGAFRRRARGWYTQERLGAGAEEPFLSDAGVNSSREELAPKMGLKIESVQLNDVMVVLPEVRGDARGFFMETYRADQFRELGLPTDFVQDNHSKSKKGVLRGLHFQWDPPMGKLMRVTRGRAFMVAVDIRKHSLTLGQWVGVEGDGEVPLLFWAPAGFARGFCVLSGFAEIEYLCSGIYNGAAEASIRWNDPTINLQWPISDPILSDRDRKAYLLADWLATKESDLVR